MDMRFAMRSLTPPFSSSQQRAAQDRRLALEAKRGTHRITQGVAPPVNFNGAKPIIGPANAGFIIVALGDGAASIVSLRDLSQ